MEGIDITIVDVPVFFHSASLLEDDIFHMVFQGRMVKFVIKTDPKLYGQYFSKRPNGSLMLYAQIKKAMYGLMRSVLLFYDKLVGNI